MFPYFGFRYRRNNWKGKHTETFKTITWNTFLAHSRPGFEH